jgi:hypothetical protein
MKPAAHEVRPVERRAGERGDGEPGRVPGPERLEEEGTAPGPVLLIQVRSVVSRRRHGIPSVLSRLNLPPAFSIRGTAYRPGG